MPHLASLVLGLVSLLWLPLKSACAFELGEPYFETVGDAESIPDNNVSALAEDHSRFLWIGTPAGLLRYDGYRFQRFGSGNGGSSDALGRAFVIALHVARDGRLCIGSDADGLWVHDLAGGHAIQFRHDPSDAGSLGHDTIRAFAEDAQGGIWIGTRRGLGYLPAKAARFTHYRHRPGDANSVNDDRINTLWVDRRGDLWVGSSNGLNRMRSGAADIAVSRFAEEVILPVHMMIGISRVCSAFCSF